MSERTEAAGLVTVSVVSHGQLALVRQLLDDLRDHCTTPIEVVLTANIPEPTELDVTAYGFPVTVLRNAEAHGFGTNHNAAFRHATGAHFCVINPDIRLDHDPFPALVGALSDERNGVAGPRVVSPEGTVEDSGRVFPTVRLLVGKLWRRGVRRDEARPDYLIADEAVFPDWIGGMCMVFRSSTFREVDGFDERYFLYYEDVDLCWRLRRAGYRVVLEPAASVVHSAHRSSWKNWRYMRWHLTSMARFLLTQARG